VLPLVQLINYVAGYSNFAGLIKNPSPLEEY
jgi:hypothetical protein